MKKKLFVSGISTEIGKTVVSSVLVEALEADYWKPVQSGDLHYTDSHKIAEWSENHASIHPETYALKIPASPHYSAREEGLEIKLENFQVPKTQNHLVAEGAGGLLVPLNENSTILDLMKQLNFINVLVSTAYLGSINHTLLSLEKMKSEDLTVDCLIFSGERNEESESIIAKLFPEVKGKFLWVEKMDVVNTQSIKQQAQKIKEPLMKILNGLD